VRACVRAFVRAYLKRRLLYYACLQDNATPRHRHKPKWVYSFFDCCSESRHGRMAFMQQTKPEVNSERHRHLENASNF